MNIRDLIIRAAALLMLLIPVGQLSAQGLVANETFRFEITQGKVTIKPVFCIPELCQTQEGEFSGSFTATFRNDKIYLSNIALKTELDFTLPEDPYTDVNGAVYDARYYFDGHTLVLDGSIDSSAFDGPIVTYSLTAQVDSTAAGFDPTGYFLARPDYRKCASPMCGGIYVKPVNLRGMVCPDGRRRQECYVGTADWSKLGFNPFAEAAQDELLLKGSVGNDVKFGRFVAEKAFGAAGKEKAKGTFFAVENNGIVCITSPCFSFDEYTLNKKRSPQTLSDIDLSHAGATDKAIETAFQLMADGYAVPVVGQNRRYKGFSGIGLRLVASQFYLPVKAPVVGECPEGYAPGELGCATKNGCLFPLLEQTIYSGVRPEEGENFPPRFECVAQCEGPAIPSGAGYCALYLP